MPTPMIRPSLTKTLEQRYASQRTGGAFNVKSVLNVKAGAVIDATSAQGQEFQSPNGFQVGRLPGNTQMKDAQGSASKQLSRYIKGFSNIRYKP